MDERGDKVKPKTLNIAVVFGGPSAEHEISLLSARNILYALSKAGTGEKNRDPFYNPIAIGITRQRHWLLIENWEEALACLPTEKLPQELRKDLGPQLAFIPGTAEPVCVRQEQGHSLAELLEPLDIDLFFPLVHGPYGEDGSLQGLFRQLGIAYVGSDVLGSAIAMDKDVMKALLRSEKRINIAEYLCFQKNSPKKKGGLLSFEALKERLALPFYVKPASQGSSIGVHRVSKKEEFHKAVEDAFSFDSKIIIEKNIEGRELECAVLGNTELQASLVGEIIIAKKDFYSYDTKYVNESDAVLYMPTELSPAEEALVQEMACRVFRILGLRGLARVDMFLDKKGKLWINEVNTMPGFTNISMYPGLWEKSGLPLASLLDRLIALAREAHQQEIQLKVRPS